MLHVFEQPQYQAGSRRNGLHSSLLTPPIRATPSLSHSTVCQLSVSFGVQSCTKTVPQTTIRGIETI